MGGVILGKIEHQLVSDFYYLQSVAFAITTLNLTITTAGSISENHIVQCIEGSHREKKVGIILLRMGGCCGV